MPDARFVAPGPARLADLLLRVRTCPSPDRTSTDYYGGLLQELLRLSSAPEGGAEVQAVVDELCKVTDSGGFAFPNTTEIDDTYPILAREHPMDPLGTQNPGGNQLEHPPLVFVEILRLVASPDPGLQNQRRQTSVLLSDEFPGGYFWNPSIWTEKQRRQAFGYLASPTDGALPLSAKPYSIFTSPHVLHTRIDRHDSAVVSQTLHFRRSVLLVYTKLLFAALEQNRPGVFELMFGSRFGNFLPSFFLRPISSIELPSDTLSVVIGFAKRFTRSRLFACNLNDSLWRTVNSPLRQAPRGRSPKTGRRFEDGIGALSHGYLPDLLLGILELKHPSATGAAAFGATAKDIRQRSALLQYCEGHARDRLFRLNEPIRDPDIPAAVDCTSNWSTISLDCPSDEKGASQKQNRQSLAANEVGWASLCVLLEMALDAHLEIGAIEMQTIPGQGSDDELNSPLELSDADVTILQRAHALSEVTGSSGSGSGSRFTTESEGDEDAPPDLLEQAELAPISVIGHAEYLLHSPEHPQEPCVSILLAIPRSFCDRPSSVQVTVEGLSRGSTVPMDDLEWDRSAWNSEYVSHSVYAYLQKDPSAAAVGYEGMEIRISANVMIRRFDEPHSNSRADKLDIFVLVMLCPS